MYPVEDCCFGPRWSGTNQAVIFDVSSHSTPHSCVRGESIFGSQPVYCVRMEWPGYLLDCYFCGFAK